MKIQLLSDIHTEFHGGDPSIMDKFFTDADVLVIAGDLTNANNIKNNIEYICKIVPHLVYVPGNHEYYHSSFDYVELTLAELEKKIPNFHWLNDSFVEIDGKRFIGGTLWVEGTDQARDPSNKWRLNDFRLIKDCDPLAFIKYDATSKYLRDHVQEGDIVVTHHLPSARSTPREFQGSLLNCYFNSNQEETMRNNKPQLWLHGHTHTACHYWVGQTQVYCNPLGYPGEQRTKFTEQLILVPK